MNLADYQALAAPYGVKVRQVYFVGWSADRIAVQRGIRKAIIYAEHWPNSNKVTYANLVGGCLQYSHHTFGSYARAATSWRAIIPFEMSWREVLATIILLTL